MYPGGADGGRGRSRGSTYAVSSNLRQHITPTPTLESLKDTTEVRPKLKSALQRYKKKVHCFEKKQRPLAFILGVGGLWINCIHIYKLV